MRWKQSQISVFGIKKGDLRQKSGVFLVNSHLILKAYLGPTPGITPGICSVTNRHIN
ncbi:hypothetical protein D3OALGB2SA_4079 [Olavius algarvensis associated proteobacterium Delta 3]|nr:hypothetical protein D3OALGB2SA_4079 [Olavius algarvensis associated proteobacterium Delta 3]